MRLTSLLLWVASVALLAQQAPPAAQRAGTIRIDVSKPAAAVPDSLYGIFFEEISHAGEGGLYAELIQNRGFEDARLPPTCRLENGFLIPPRTPHFDTSKPSNWRLRWDVTGETPAWTLDTSGGAEGAMTLVDVEPLTPATPHSLQVDVTSVGGRG